eukprot:g5985.t1
MRTGPIKKRAQTELEKFERDAHGNFEFASKYADLCKKTKKKQKSTKKKKKKKTNKKNEFCFVLKSKCVVGQQESKDREVDQIESKDDPVVAQLKQMSIASDGDHKGCFYALIRDIILKRILRVDEEEFEEEFESDAVGGEESEEDSEEESEEEEEEDSEEESEEEEEESEEDEEEQENTSSNSEESESSSSSSSSEERSSSEEEMRVETKIPIRMKKKKGRIKNQLKKLEALRKKRKGNKVHPLGE